MGDGNFTDMLAVSLSSPDKIGYRFGPNSIEVEDNYLRLDQELASFFNYLDNRFGKDGYLFFITADHGVGHSPGYLEENRIPSGVIDGDAVQRIGAVVDKKDGTSNIILSFASGQVYSDYDVLSKKGLNRTVVANDIVDQLKQEAGIENAFVSEALGTVTLPDPIKSMFTNGYHSKRSGDILIVRSAGWKTGSRDGATHSGWYPYNAHIPLVWMGWGITHGETNRTTKMTDIAPTLAALLNIQMPSGNIGDVITEITNNSKL